MTARWSALQHLTHTVSWTFVCSTRAQIYCDMLTVCGYRNKGSHKWKFFTIVAFDPPNPALHNHEPISGDNFYTCIGLTPSPLSTRFLESTFCSGIYPTYAELQSRMSDQTCIRCSYYQIMIPLVISSLWLLPYTAWSPFNAPLSWIAHIPKPYPKPGFNHIEISALKVKILVNNAETMGRPDNEDALLKWQPWQSSLIQQGRSVLHDRYSRWRPHTISQMAR